VEIDFAVGCFQFGEVVLRIESSHPDAFGMIQNLPEDFFSQRRPRRVARADGVFVKSFGRRLEHAPQSRQVHRSQRLAERLAQNERHGFQRAGFRHRVFHERPGVSRAVGRGRRVKGLGNRRNEPQAVGDPQMDFAQLQRFSLRFDNGTAHLKIDARVSHREKRSVPGFVAGPRRQHIVRQGRRLCHGDFRRDQKIQFGEGVFIGCGVRVGTQRIRSRHQNRPQAIGMIGENFLRHDVGRKDAANRKGIGGRGAPDFGVSFIRMRSDGHHVAVNDIAAVRANPAADRLENDEQIRIEGAVAAHENAQVVAQRRFARGEKSGDLADPVEIQFADRDGGARVEVCKKGFHRVETGRMIGQIALVFPSLVENDSNQRLDEQRIRAGPDLKMDVGQLGRFRNAGIDDDERFFRVPGKALQLPGGLGNLMALHAVPAEGQKDVGVFHVGLVVQVLASVRASDHPEGAGEFLRQRSVMVLRPQSAQEADAEGRFEMAALRAGSHVGERARAVLFDDIPQTVGDFADGLIPGNPFELSADFFQRIFEPVGVVLVIGDVQALAADVAFAFGIGFVRPDFDDAVIFDFDDETAVLCAQDAAGFEKDAHGCFLSPASCPDVCLLRSYALGV